MRKLVKWTAGVVGGMVILAVVLAAGLTLMLNTTSVQNKLVKRATELLAEKLQTNIAIDSVDIDLFKQSVGIYGLDIEDQQQRKMLQLRSVTLNLGLWALLNNNIVVKKADIEGLSALLLKPSKDEPGNYQFVIDAFKKRREESGERSVDGEERREEGQFSFDIGHLSLRDISIQYNGSCIRLKEGEYNKALLSSHQTLTIDSLTYTTDNHKPRKNTGKPHRGAFDPGHLDLSVNMKVTLNHVGKDSVDALIEECQAWDKESGIDVRSLRMHVTHRRDSLRLTDVEIVLPNTTLHTDYADVRLPNKSKGTKLCYSTGPLTGKVVLKDIAKTFAPVLGKFTIPLSLNACISGSGDSLDIDDVKVETYDQKLTILALGKLRNLKDKQRMNLHFNVRKMEAKSGIKEKIISQFPVKRYMMKQLHALGNIAYRGTFNVLWRKEQFQGILQTGVGNLVFQFAIDNANKYISGKAKSKQLNLGQVLEKKEFGNIDFEATFKFDISKERTARMKRKTGGKLPIGNVDAFVNDVAYRKIHLKGVSADITSDGTIAQGRVVKNAKWSDLYSTFTFTSTDQMHKMKVKPGIRFHKRGEGKEKKEKRTDKRGEKKSSKKRK